MKEFQVIGKATRLLEEVVRLTSKAPKKYRFSLCKKMDDLAMTIVENIYQANDNYVSGANQVEVYEKRLELELEALSKIKLLTTLARVATENQCMSKGEFGVLAKLIHDCQLLLGAWYKSDRKKQEACRSHSSSDG